MLAILLLLISNGFMTFAWYQHLKHCSSPIIDAIAANQLSLSALWSGRSKGTLINSRAGRDLADPSGVSE
jgi:hypothetical protein